MKALVFIAATMLSLLSSPAAAQKNTGGYALMRVFDCNKAVGLGTGYITARILIVYEDGKTEEVELQHYSEKTELDNLKKVNEVLNKMKAAGYFLIAQSTTGDQGALITDYTFMKQP